MRESQAAFVLLLLLLVAACGSAGGDGHAYEVETPRTGRYEKIKANVGVVVSNSSIEARIPANVTEGDLIHIEYEVDGRKVVDQMPVRRISIKQTSGEVLCRLHSAPERTVGDTVYVKPCIVLR